VRTANGFVIATIYHDEEPRREFNLRREEARRVAVAISRPGNLRLPSRRHHVAAAVLDQSTARIAEMLLVAGCKQKVPDL
jgi:hypothetical protein